MLDFGLNPSMNDVLGRLYPTADATPTLQLQVCGDRALLALLSTSLSLPLSPSISLSLAPALSLSPSLSLARSLMSTAASR